MVWLHGTLVVKIDAARDVPTEPVLEGSDKMANNKIVKAINKIQKKIGMHTDSDPYCAITIGASTRARTAVKHNDSNPEWDETFQFLVADQCDDVTVWLKDADNIGATRIGSISFAALDILSDRPIDGWFYIRDHVGEPVKHVQVKLSITYMPVEDIRGLRGGLGPVPDVYFPLRTGCRVRLYNDAHQEPGQVVTLPTGRQYESRSLWTDMYNDILKAKAFIYVTGWSVHMGVQLVRDPTKAQKNNDCLGIGELLIQKAEEGIRVLVLPWDDRTGIMGTHDESVYKFFHGTKVKCKKILRSVAEVAGITITQKLKTGAFFTHHQKAVIMDTEETDGTVRVAAYIGGVDLTVGRYDTREHSLFRTLANVHSEDFYNLAWPKATTEDGGPRQPWHDIHSRLEGGAALDVLHNFEQRWGTMPGQDVQLLTLTQVNIYRPCQLSPMHPANDDPAVAVLPPDDPESWAVQVFRSIDEDSVRGFPSSTKEQSNNKEAMALGLSTGAMCTKEQSNNKEAMALGPSTDKGKAVDHSIHKAYVHAIRRAQHFIYIENQYFLGSSQMWEDNETAGSINLIPVELALKIVSKIDAGERFAVYVVMPLYPEGDPYSLAIKEILRFQHDTKCMMYKMIAEALYRNGRGNEHPRDFLAFFCLGNREPQTFPDEPGPSKSVKPDSYQGRCQASRRYMVYVHSKLMIVDDEYIIVGSANINQRSMDGSRDTEIAMGAFQPGHLAGTLPTEVPAGEIHGFRLSLWAEHTGSVLPFFSDPASVECIRAMERIGAINWGAFAADELVHMPSHLMSYPVDVTYAGRVDFLESHRFIPDTEVPVLGSTTNALPDQLTT